MDIFIKQVNRAKNEKMVIFILIACIISYAFFMRINEKRIHTFYQTSLNSEVQDTETILKDKTILSDKEFKKAIEEDLMNIKKQINSINSKDQSYFLQEEIKNLYLNQELVDEYKGLDYENYNIGKKKVNQYLIRNKLPMKSIQYSTDSAIFLTNLLEFMNSPIFFFLFFLLTSYSYFMKFENRKVNLLLALPIERQKIVNKDYFSFLLNLLKWVLTVILIAFIISFLFSFNFSWNYPVLITLFGMTRIVPIYFYMLILLIALLFIGTFFFFLSYFFTIILKKAMVSMLLALLMCFSMLFFIETSTNPMHGLNPFSYLNTEKLVKNRENENNMKKVVYSEKHIPDNNTSEEIFPNIIENPYYYANDSISRRIKTIDIVFLPFILGIYSFILYILVSIFLSKYTT